MPKPNLNTASVAELMTIRGMDAATAFYIWRARRIRRLRSWDDLAERLRLPAAVMDWLRREAVLGARPRAERGCL